ncbi:lipopolysaccharide biosynthesis protein [Halomonas sp. ANAO-440]|uniref:lipopolysaccharide biosynthesis protein n=1 Tax=Halomonas sp. ANAO-440 TaxID=2861360 RepID=UPI001CAA6725|nr:lipopolysaccharide biosynthesis protein [Halomonas sp. ANAO-440]MBZ0329193.1 lipopolysaccharide biosynthesis protein [Halomonas sp. ANAO-440]
MLKNRTMAGVLWNFLEQLSKRGISIAVTLLLARLLLPEDFGLLAMMSVFVTIASVLMDSGLKQAVIRKKNAQQADYNTAFYANILVGILSYSILYISAPWISSFYDEPRLVLLIRVAGLLVIINSFQIVQSAILSRKLNFKAQLQASVPASILSGSFAVFLAYNGAGVWALVAQMMLSGLLLTIFLWRLQSWRPSLTFSWSSFKEMYSFGYKLFLASLLSHFTKNIYVLTIGSVFGTAVAGLYYFSYRLKELVVSQLVSAVQKVTFPALATMQDDNVRLKKSYRKVLRATTFVLFPCILLTASLAEPLFEFALPERWLDASIYLQIMFLASMLYPLHAINLNILKVKGRTDIYLGISVFRKFFTFFVLFISYRYGVVGILVGQIFLSIFAYIPNSYYSHKLIGYSVREQLADCASSFILSAVIFSGIYFSVQYLVWSPLVKLLFFAPLGVMLYIGLAKIFKVKAYKQIEELVRSRLNIRGIGRKYV